MSNGFHARNALAETTSETNAEATSELGVHPESSGAEFIGSGVNDRRSTRSEPAGGDPRDPTWHDAQCLVNIARRHAALALASPAETRASHLDACRRVWIYYAAAFGAKPAMQTRFADELQDVTRRLMAAQQKAAASSSATSAERHQPPDAATTIITIEELRPILRQIIRR
jgi:hypothetical protein